MEKLEKENQYIKDFTIMRHTWHGVKGMWVIRILSLDGQVGSVEVTSFGFSSFREAADKAVALFRVNIRNEVPPHVITKVVLNGDGKESDKHATEEWPELIDA